MKRGGGPGRRRTTPKSTSSLRQLSTSSRMRPKVDINDSTSNDSSGRALKYRRIPARSGDWTRFLKRVSRETSGESLPGRLALARRAAYVKSSTVQLDTCSVSAQTRGAHRPGGRQKDKGEGQRRLRLVLLRFAFFLLPFSFRPFSFSLALCLIARRDRRAPRRSNSCQASRFGITGRA